MIISEKKYNQLISKLNKEDQALTNKITKLEKFIFKNSGELDKTMFYIMCAQYSAMCNYHFMLNARIEELGFHVEDDEEVL